MINAIAILEIDCRSQMDSVGLGVRERTVSKFLLLFLARGGANVS